MSNFILDQYGRHIRRKGGEQHNTLSNWVTNSVQRFTIEAEKRKVSDRSWDLYLNGSVGHGLLEGIVIDVVGTGITPVFSPIESITGLKDEQYSNYVETLTTLWDICASDPRKFFDAQRRNSLAKLQALALFLWKIDGIAIFQVNYSKSTRFSPTNISLRPIDPYYVKTPDTMMNQDIYDGIRVNESTGQPESIFVFKNNNQHTEYPIYDQETGLPLFLIVTDTRNLYEYRQDSILSCMMKEIKDSEEATDAVLVKFLISNLFTAFIKDSNFFDTYDGDPEDLSYNDRTVELDKGTMIHGAAGEEPVMLGSSDQPNQQYEVMNKSILQRLGVATVRGSELLTRQFNNSYSAARAALENSNRVDNYDVSLLNDNFNNPLAAWFTYDLILQGKIKTRKSIDFVKENIFAYSKAQWITQPRVEIDQLKSAQVDSERLRNGTTTYAQIWAQRGLRPKEQFKVIIEEVKKIEEMEIQEGIDLSFMKRDTILPNPIIIEEKNDDA